MQIKPTFLAQLRRICGQNLEPSDPLRQHLEGMIDRIPLAARSDQHQIMADLFTALGRRHHAVRLGFMIGGQLPMTAFGVLSLGAMTAPTVGDALRFFATVHPLAVPLIGCSYEETPSQGRLTIGFRSPISPEGEALCVATCAALLDREMARYSGRSSNFARMELTPSSRGTETGYRQFLSLAPYTGGSSNVLVLDRTALNLANPTADFDTFSDVMRASLERVDLQLDGAASLLEQMREVIMSDIGAPPSQDRLAKRLDLSPRQLRARLKWRNTSYQAIVRDCRTEYASALLMNPSLSLSKIAGRLGYSELPAFSHAFYRWTGKSPSTYRLEMLARRASP